VLLLDSAPLMHRCLALTTGGEKPQSALLRDPITDFHCRASLLYRNTIFNRLDNLEPLRVVEMSRGRVRWGSWRGSPSCPIRNRHEDEDKAMRITCYLICALSIAILVGLLLYTMSP
jgi:hypothetical protein